MRRLVHLYGGAAPGISAATLQVVISPLEWDVGHPVFGRYLEWSLASSMTRWSHYVTLGDVRRSVYEGYREAVEHGFPLSADEREVHLSECTDPSRWDAVPGGGGGSVSPVPGFVQEPAPRAWLTRARAGSAQAVSFRLDEDVADERHGAFASGDGPTRAFLSLTGATTRSVQAFAEDRNRELRVALRGCALIRSRPRAWYNPALVSAFARHMHPRVGHEDAPGAGWWGPRGLLALMPSAFIVAYQPRVELRVGPGTHAELQAGWAGARRVSIGPFVFQVDRGAEVTVRPHSDGSFTYRCESRSELLQVIGAASTVLGAPDYVASSGRRDPSRGSSTIARIDV
ncbi:MAG: hypothetical protein KC636_14430 [Myxococcales bacterium]|nr:hypothetical protein [Myxococcales bacterium]